MPPRSRFARPVANRVFTNREQPLAYFNAARRHLDPGRQRLLSFYGVGGQGKTALCRPLRQILESEDPKRNLWGHLDFEEVPVREPARGLPRLRNSLRASGRIRFAAFDVTHSAYRKKAYPTEDPHHALEDLLADSQGVLPADADNVPDVKRPPPPQCPVRRTACADDGSDDPRMSQSPVGANRPFSPILKSPARAAEHRGGWP